HGLAVLVGLPARVSVAAAWPAGLGHGRLILVCLATFAAAVALRPLWIFPMSPVLLHKRRTWRVSTVLSWAGMRGVVTLAAVFVLPSDTALRPVLVLLALVVVGGTLLLQGTTLPWLVRRLQLRGPSAAEDALQIANLLQRVTQAGERSLSDIPEVPPELATQLVARDQSRTTAAWERLGPRETERATPSETYRRLRLKMLRAE